MEGPQTVHLITVHISCSQTEFHLKENDLPIFKKKKKTLCALPFFLLLPGVIYLHIQKNVFRASKLIP